MTSPAKPVMTGPDFQGQRAGIVTRSLACVVDMLMVLVLLVAVWAVAAAVVFLSRPARFTLPSPSWSLVVGIASVASVLYLAVCWATTGRTYGAQLLGLRVVDRRAVRLGWTRSTARAVAYVVFPLGLGWAVVDKHNRSLQDLLLASAVIYDWIPRVPATGATRSQPMSSP